MVIVAANRFFWEDRLIFFPTSAEIDQTVRGLTPRSIVRIWQTTADLHDEPRIIERGIFRTSCVNLSKAADAIFGEMYRTSRSQIRKAEKLQQRLHIALNEGSGVEEHFFRLYNDFVLRKGHQPPVSRRRLAEYLKVSDLWLLYLDGRPLCGHVFVRDSISRRARLIFSASPRLSGVEDTQICSSLNRYLHWQEMQRYKAQGMETFDFGGIGDGTNSIARFKLSLGGQRIQEHTYVLTAPLNAVLFRAYKFYQRVRLGFPKHASVGHAAHT